MTEINGATQWSSSWRTLIAFLNRDIRSFFPRAKAEPEVALLPVLPIEQRLTATTLVDSKKLDVLRYRREILDWRDDFIFNLSRSERELRSNFENFVDRELNDVSLFRRALSKPASTILKAAFDGRVRFKLSSEARLATARLSEILSKWNIDDQVRPRALNDRSDPNLSCIAEIGFKPSNKSKILSQIDSRVIGQIVSTYQNQASRIALELIDKEHK